VWFIMGDVLEITANSWEQHVLRSEVLTVVDFWHTHCPWCLKFDSVLDEASEEYKNKIKFVKLNVLDDPNARQLAFQYGIMSTPTLVFFCRGRPVEQAVGFMVKERLKKFLDDLLSRYTECTAQSTELKT